MESGKNGSTPKWILVATGVVGIISALLVAGAKYYELRKARAEAHAQENSAVPHPPGREEDGARAPVPNARPDARVATSPVVYLQADPPFDKYLRANPILLEVAGVKVIRLAGGGKVIMSIASTELKDDSAAERIRAERVCRVKAATGILKENVGVQLAHAESLRDGTVAVTTDVGPVARPLPEVLEMTIARVEGVVKEMPPVGRWKSLDGKIFFLATGLVLGPDGLPATNNLVP